MHSAVHADSPHLSSRPLRLSHLAVRDHTPCQVALPGHWWPPSWAPQGRPALTVCLPPSSDPLCARPRPASSKKQPLSPASGSCLESGRRGEAAASSTRCGCCGAGGPGAAGRGAGVRVCAGPQPRAPEAPRDLGGHDEAQGPWQRFPLPLAGPRGRDPGARHKSRPSLSCGNVSPSCGAAPSPRGPPRGLPVLPGVSGGLLGVPRAGPRGSLALTPHEGGEVARSPAGELGQGPFQNILPRKAGSGLRFLLPAPHVPIFILFLFALSLHFVSNS